MNLAHHPCCPTCGQQVRRLPRFDEIIVAAGLAGDEKRIFTILAAARGRFVSTKDLADILFADREDGGPLHAARAISVTMYHLRRKLAAYPVGIKGKSGMHSSQRLVSTWSIVSEGHRGFMLAPEERVAA